MRRFKTVLALTLIGAALPLSSCSNDDFDQSKFVVTVSKSFQVYDNFHKSDLSVTYDGSSLPEDDYIVDYEGLDTSKPGECHIYVSPVNKENIKIDVPITISKRKSANMLSFGDGFNKDALYYAQQIYNAKSSSEDKWSFNVYLASCDDYSIDSLYNDFLTDNKNYRLSKFNNETYSWLEMGTFSAKEVLDNENIHWDFIEFGQDACLSGKDESLAKIAQLSSYVDAYLGKNKAALPCYAYSMPFAYSDGVQVTPEFNLYYNNSQENMMNAIINTTKSTFENSKALVIPNGTLIQNLRANGIYNDEQISSNGTNIILNEIKCSLSLLTISSLSGFEIDEFEDIFNYDLLKNLDVNKVIQTYNIIKETLKHPYQVSIIN